MLARHFSDDFLNFLDLGRVQNKIQFKNHRDSGKSEIRQKLCKLHDTCQESQELTKAFLTNLILGVESK
jgi:hypothetical protein